ncbi:MAG: Ig-like domain-containing protein [Lachnospiraceae bacterium]|nr:Ig-like domain-containing protein [Lachnospiraceae bacterium]
MRRRVFSVLVAALAVFMLISSAVPAHAIARAVILDHDTLTLYPGEKAKITMYVGNGEMDPVRWKSSKKSVAAVSKKGVVTAKKAGTAVISCETGYGYDLKCTVKVKKCVEISSYLNKKYKKLLKKLPDVSFNSNDPMSQGNLYTSSDGQVFFRCNKKTKKISVLQNASDKGLTLYGVKLNMKAKTAKKKLLKAGYKYKKKVPAATVTDYIFKKSGHQITVKVSGGKVSCVQWAR